MHVGIARSRWALRVHCVRSVWKILSQSGRVESLDKLSQEAKASHRGLAVTKERVVRENKKRERERQAEVSKDSLFFEVLFPSFECELACLSPSIFVVPCVQSEGWKEG